MEKYGVEVEKVDVCPRCGRGTEECGNCPKCGSEPMEKEKPEEEE